MNQVRIIPVEWRSPEWFAMRRGYITASEIHRVFSKPTTKSFRLYQRQLILDHADVPDHDDIDPKPWFLHGEILEPRARGAYEWKHDVEVVHDVFCIHPGGILACTPDGLIGDPGGLEIKGRKYRYTYDRSISQKPTKREWLQIQCCLYVTGRSWWDYVNYYEHASRKVRKMNVQRIVPDRVAFQDIETGAAKFMELVYQGVAQYQAQGMH